MALLIGKLMPTRAVAAMATGGKENLTNTDSGIGDVEERAAQINKALPHFSCITCNTQAVVWPESECPECKGKRVYHPGDLVVIMT